MPKNQNADSSKSCCLEKGPSFKSKRIVAENDFKIGGQNATGTNNSQAQVSSSWKKIKSENVEDWGGELRIPSAQIINATNSCTVNHFLQILYVFYSTLNIHEMRKPFGSEHIIVTMVRKIVQMLSTEAFPDAILYWLNRVCSLSIGMDKKVLDSFGTDKQVTLHQIRYLFRRRYQFICSAGHCPSKSFVNNTSVSDTVSDMTLHEASACDTDGLPLPLQNSIREWELGTSEKALVSCKERFWRSRVMKTS